MAASRSRTICGKMQFTVIPISKKVRFEEISICGKMHDSADAISRFVHYRWRNRWRAMASPRAQ